MIAIQDSQSNSSESASVPEEVTTFFRDGGTLEKACKSARGDASWPENESFVFEIRPQQMAMAKAVSQALLEPEHLAVEAGAGVGKTFAYLVPLILLAKKKKRQVAVSTHTINLQEQLVFKDIPFLKQHMGLDINVALCKGRGNYLCLRRLSLARRMSSDLFNKAQEREIEMIQIWADETQDGSLSDFPAAARQEKHALSLSKAPAPDVWSQVCSEHDNCLGRKCPHYGRCFVVKARSRASEADLLILNHHLFFSDLALRNSGNGGFLPELGILVLDEAHCLENTATEHLGIRLSQGMFEHWLRRLYVPDSGKGLLAVLKESEMAHVVSRLWDNVEHFFLEVKHWTDIEEQDSPPAVPAARAEKRDRQDIEDIGPKKPVRSGTTLANKWVVSRPMMFSTVLLERLAKVIYQLTRIVESIENPDIKAEFLAITRRGVEIRDSLDVFLKQSLENHVYWVEREGARLRFVLHSAPIEVGPILETMLFDTFDSIVMTSATLSADGTLDYFKTRIGARNSRELVVGSPFNYSRQMRVFIAGGMPDPNRGTATSARRKVGPSVHLPQGGDVRGRGNSECGTRNSERRKQETVYSFTDAAAQGICYFVEKTRGRAFVLFTSVKMMKTVARQLRSFFSEQGLTLLVQGEGMPRHIMLEQFRTATESGAVLFGVDSFWMGVDVRGDALSNVIIVRLPFSVPDEPVTKARMDCITARGGDPFREYSLPEALLKFRQGVGRLIRTATDEGIIAVLDSRIVTRWYGRFFLNAIPECPVEVVDSTEFKL